MSHSDPQRRPLTLRDAYRFFVPLMLMSELMMISHAVIAAFLARMPDPEAVLAAYSVAFYFHAVLGGPIWAMQMIVLSFLRDRAAVRRLAVFGALVVGYVTSVSLVFGLTSAGDWLFQDVFGTTAAVASEARLCLVVSVLMLPFSIFRSLAYGLMMVNRRTLFVTFGTVVRMFGLVAILAIASQRFNGAVVGVVALGGCIGIEIVYAVLLGRRFYRALPVRTQAPPGFGELWRFGWPIMFMQMAESGVAVTVNFFLGRLLRPELALAAFGVLDSIIRVLLSPLRNLVHSAQSLVRTRADARVLVVFTVQMGLFFAALLLLLQIPPVQRLALTGIMGLGDDMAAYIANGLAIGALLALVMASAGVCRGLLIAAHHTGSIAIGSVVRIVAVAAIGAIALLVGLENGATLGMIALIAAFAAETALLVARMRQIERSGVRLFER